MLVSWRRPAQGGSPPGEPCVRVAIVHYWLLAERGGEKVVRALCDLYPSAVIFTHVSDPALTGRLFPGHEIRHSFIARLPFARRQYKKYLPLMPAALEGIDLSGFDLVISSEAGPAKGVIPPPDATHVCYCHSPMRYLWDQRHIYGRSAPFLQRAMLGAVSTGLRQWDVTSAARVDRFIANSAFVARRIRKYYRRTADVAHPPVEVERFSPARRPLDRAPFSGAYLWLGQLTGYKRPDLAVAAAARLGRRLVVIGEGEEFATLRRTAPAGVTFLGRVDDATVSDALAACRALVFPGEEDFGIAPVEAMAAGTPVIAFARGGATETVVDGETGVLFRDQTVEGLADAMTRFEQSESGFAPERLAAHASRFSKASFLARMRVLIESATRSPRGADCAQQLFSPSD